MRFFVVYIISILFVIACSTNKLMEVPKDTPLSTMGKRFFYDNRLSANHTKSCASCHAPQFAFSDGYRRSMGIEADETLHNAPSLLNTKYYFSLTWSNPHIVTYEQQMLQPLFKKVHPELGLDSANIDFLKIFHNDSIYQVLYQAAFAKRIELLSYNDIIKAIAAYEKTLISFQSPYDWYRHGKKNAISASAKNGERIFFQAKCQKCHPYPLLTDANRWDGFHQILPLDEKDFGVYEFTKKEHQKGKFRTPTLRNIALTAPYMHDGSVENLSDAMQHSIQFTETARKDLLNFLHTLTDSTVFER